jgi:hypothetical protein
MDKKELLKGIIKGFEKMGAKFIKVDHFDFFFEIKKGSDIDDDEKLKTIKNAFFGNFGLGLKIRRV